MPWWRRKPERMVRDDDADDRRTAIVLAKLDYAVAHFENRARALEELLRAREAEEQRRRGQAS